MSCEHAFLALLDALEIQRSILGDVSRGADVDKGPHRGAFEALEHAAVTEANRLTADASVPAVVRARARAFVTASTRTPTRSGFAGTSSLRPSPTPQPGAVMPRMTTPIAQLTAVAVLPRIASGARPPPSPGPVPPRASPASAFPGLAAVGALGPDAAAAARVRVEDHLTGLTADWTCPQCNLDVARTLHVSRVLGGRSAVLVDVICANCSRRSPLPTTQNRAFDRLFGPLVGQSGAGFRPDAHGLQWDGT